MPSAKDIRVAAISSRDANALIRAVHYSGKIVRNSCLHLGVFLDGRLEGAMQFGPSLDKRKVLGLVQGTPWNGFLELNRLAFTDRLPRNSESRALGIALRMIRKHYPHIQWIISFADGTQCGDGTIYRAAGFLLTAIKRNSTIWGDGEHILANASYNSASPVAKQQLLYRITNTKAGALAHSGAASMKMFAQQGFKPLPGFHLRYLYFLDPTARARLTVPVLPFSQIEEMSAAMYRGKPRAKQAMAGHHPAQRRGSTDLHAPAQGMIDAARAQADPSSREGPQRKSGQARHTA